MQKETGEIEILGFGGAKYLGRLSFHPNSKKYKGLKTTKDLTLKLYSTSFYTEYMIVSTHDGGIDASETKLLIGSKPKVQTLTSKTETQANSKKKT